jgi:hypothetical protein
MGRKISQTAARVTQPCAAAVQRNCTFPAERAGCVLRTISRYEDSASMFRLAEDMILRALGAESAE